VQIMTDVTKVPGRKPRPQNTNNAGIAGFAAARQAPEGMPLANPAWHVDRLSPWPFKAGDTSPLAWWRTLPSDSFRDAERLLLLATLDGIAVLGGGAEFAAALEGDAAAAMSVTCALMPITEITLKTDIAVTALLRCALEADAAAALVLAQLLGLTDLGHAFGTELAASWYTYGLRHSANPRKFSEAGTILLAAFRERERDGGGA
jgi:hypothetical protein